MLGHYDVCRYAECRYAECRYAECRGVQIQQSRTRRRMGKFATLHWIAKIEYFRVNRP
jgi:hypothetical protein